MQLFTLEIRSTEGELLFLRARAAEHIQYMLANKIIPSEGFAAGNYKIIIRPFKYFRGNPRRFSFVGWIAPFAGRL